TTSALPKLFPGDQSSVQLHGLVRNGRPALRARPTQPTAAQVVAALDAQPTLEPPAADEGGMPHDPPEGHDGAEKNQQPVRHADRVLPVGPRPVMRRSLQCGPPSGRERLTPSVHVVRSRISRRGYGDS